MSQRSKFGLLSYLSRIDRLLSDNLESAREMLTPHNLMNSLKRPYNQDSGLTELGKLIKESLSNPSRLDMIRWIVFHFDLPVEYFEGDETAKRNWISIRVDEQPLLNRVHQNTIEKGTDYINKIYAPSVLSARLLKVLPQAAAEKLREKWWLYKLDASPLGRQERQHRSCSAAKYPDSDIMCFAYDGQHFVHVFSCRNDHHLRKDSSCKLGYLLGGEDESQARKRFLGFVDLIKYQPAAKFNLASSKACLNCNFYARIPVFFFRRYKKYMSEVFIAFYNRKDNIESVVRTLHELVPCLKICVSLVNSQIAYTFGEIESEKKERIRSVARVTHVLSNQLREAISRADAIPDIIPQKAGLIHRLSLMRDLEEFSRYASRASSNNEDLSYFESKPALEKIRLRKLVDAVISTIKDVCKILEMPECSNVALMAKRVRGINDSLYNEVTKNLFTPEPLPDKSLYWQSRQLYVAVDTILHNALKYCSSKVPALRASLQINEDGEDEGLFLMVRNSTTYSLNDLEEAEMRAKALSRCDNVDWLGISTLHIACQAVGFKRPSWKIVFLDEYPGTIFFESKVQIARFALKNGERSVAK